MTSRVNPITPGESDKLLGHYLTLRILKVSNLDWIPLKNLKKLPISFSTWPDRSRFTRIVCLQANYKLVAIKKSLEPGSEITGAN